MNNWQCDTESQLIYLHPKVTKLWEREWKACFPKQDLQNDCISWYASMDGEISQVSTPRYIARGN